MNKFRCFAFGAGVPFCLVLRADDQHEDPAKCTNSSHT